MNISLPPSGSPGKAISFFPRKRAVWVAFCLALSSFFIFDHFNGRAFWLDEAGIANLLSNPWHSLASNVKASYFLRPAGAKVNEQQACAYHRFTATLLSELGHSQ